MNTFKIITISAVLFLGLQSHSFAMDEQEDRGLMQQATQVFPGLSTPMTLPSDEKETESILGVGCIEANENHVAVEVNDSNFLSEHFLNHTDLQSYLPDKSVVTDEGLLEEKNTPKPISSSHKRKRIESLLDKKHLEEFPSVKKIKQQQSTRNTLIDELPDELLLYIFSFLNQRDVPPVSRVSKRWLQLMEDNQLWKTYARRAKLIWEEDDNLQERNYKTLIKEHCTFSFIDLGALNGGDEAYAQGVSFDGSVVVGYAADGIEHNRDTAFRWTLKEGIQPLGALNEGSRSGATGVNADGSVIVGWVEDEAEHNRATAFRWTLKEGIQSLGTLNGRSSSEATGVSADGSVIVGVAYDHAAQDQQRAFRWTAGKGMESLGTLNGGKWSHATGVNSDGSVIVGEADDGAGRNQTRAFRWTQEEGMQSLGVLNGGKRSHATGVSSDGAVIIGKGDDIEQNGDTAFHWTLKEGIQPLGALNDGESYAAGVSSDGSVIVGTSTTEEIYEAFRWTREKEIKSVEESLVEKDILPWLLPWEREEDMETIGESPIEKVFLPWGMLKKANAITPNGVVLVGQGEWKAQVENEENTIQPRAWRAIIPRGNLF